VIKFENAWGAIDPDLPTTKGINPTKFMPQHHSGNHKYPDGGNEVFTDGSAKFCRFQDMYEFTTWSSGSDARCWFYQSVADITDQPSLTALKNLKWTPADD
jgi:hypothetical protein